MRSIFLIFILLMSHQGSASLLEQLRLETEIEEKVNNNLRTTLATQLKPETFNLAVRVKIQSRKKEDRTKEVKDTSPQVAAGLGFADVDVQKIIDSYERELEVVKRSKDLSQVDYNISSMTILVGVSELYTDEYVATLADWLKKYSVKNYGANVITQVSRMKPAPTNPEIKEKEKSALDYAKDLQTILAALLLGLAGLLAVLLYRLFEKKTLQSSAAPSPLSPPALNSELEEGEPSAKHLDSLSFQEVDFFTNTLERLRQRIHDLVLAFGSDLPHLLVFWLEQENEGLQKICCLTEAVQTEVVERAVQEVTSDKSEQIVAINQAISNQPINERIRIYEAVYWDLNSYRLLGASAYRQPFSFLNTGDTDLAEQAILKEDSDTKAVIIAFMRGNRQARITSKLSFSEKQTMIQYLVSTKNLETRKIVDSEATLKLSLAQQKSRGSDKAIDLLPKALQFIESLEILEQTEILYSFYRKRDQIVETLKAQVFSLAFLGDWNEAFAREVFKVASPEEAFTFYSCFPTLEGKIFKYLPVRTAAILKDEIQRNTSVSQAEKQERLSTFREKALMMMESSGLNLAQIYETSQDEISKAA